MGFTEYIDAVGGAYRSQLAAAQRGALVPCLALGVAGTAYLLLTEAMGLDWSSALGTVYAIALPLLVAIVWRGESNLTQLEAVQRSAEEQHLSTLRRNWKHDAAATTSKATGAFPDNPYCAHIKWR